MGKLKVIFDTDPGVDDAMALLLLARHPDIDLVGVTTVFGNGSIDTTTRNALYLKQRFGFSAPVARGAASALTGDVREPSGFVHGENGLGDVPLSDVHETADPRPAAQLIIDLVRANPGEITIIAVGRMTNLAVALQLDPGFATLVKDVVVMGGAFGRNGHTGNVTPVAEANIYGDPLAADIAFGAPWPLTIVGLDATKETMMTQEYLRQLTSEGDAQTQFLWDISRFYENFYLQSGQSTNGFPVHDASAVVCALHPDWFEFERGPVRVVTEGIAKGQTILRPEMTFRHAADWNGRPDARVAVGVDSPRMLDLYRRTVTGRG